MSSNETWLKSAVLLKPVYFTHVTARYLMTELDLTLLCKAVYGEIVTTQSDSFACPLGSASPRLLYTMVFIGTTTYL